MSSHKDYYLKEVVDFPPEIPWITTMYRMRLLKNSVKIAKI